MTMKKILRFVVLLIVIFLVVEIYVHFLTKVYYKDFNNYKILTQSPEIKITECKTANKKGYIQGKTINNTGEMLRNVNIKLDFYNKQGTKIGTEYKTIEVFNVGEEFYFDVDFTYKNVAEIKIDIISK